MKATFGFFIILQLGELRVRTGKTDEQETNRSGDNTCPQSLYVEKAMAASGASPEDIAKTLLIQVPVFDCVKFSKQTTLFFLQSRLHFLC